MSGSESAQGGAAVRPPLPAQLGLARTLAATAVINTVIAAFLTLLRPEHSFTMTLVYSQAIGFAIALLVRPVLRSNLGRGWRLAGMALAIPLGAAIGIKLGFALTGWPASVAQQRSLGIDALAIGLVFGVTVSALFALRDRVGQAEQQLAEETLRLVTAEKAAVQMELRMLQAQIEPHFLFNTLANVVSRIDTSPQEAKRLLEETIRYLRATLARTRAGGGTLGQELAIVEAYLAIQQMRLGPRLAWSIEVGDELRACACPPLLLQPLVENAVGHGIEPAVAGGRVDVTARRQGQGVLIRVADTGRGLGHGSGGSGVGLANVRERLRALYGGGARLGLRENQPQGTVAEIELPCGPVQP